MSPTPAGMGVPDLCRVSRAVRGHSGPEARNRFLCCPAAMPLDRILLRLYGNDASKHFDEVLQLIRIPNALLIPSGTTLQIVSPQPIQ